MNVRVYMHIHVHEDDIKFEGSKVMIKKGFSC